MTPRLFRRSNARRSTAALLTLIATGLPAATLELHPTRTGRFDLELTGHIAGVPAGEKRYVTWSDLRALPSRTIKVTGEFVPGEQQVTIVLLTDFWNALPRGEGVDVLLATCVDGYAAVFRADFIASHLPFFILEINGHGPEHWPPAGLAFNPGPYVISVAHDVAPAVATMLDAPHKRPWGVATVALARYDEAFRNAASGRWANLTPSAQQGRDIWINSCTCCHVGPGKMFGGTKGEQPYPVLEAIAGYNPDFFKKYVRNPTSVNPDAEMEAHPHYNDEQLAALVAFITADGRK